MSLNELVFHVESVGLPLEDFAEEERAYLLKGLQGLEEAERAQREAELLRQMTFWPLTAQVVAIGMLNVETDKGQVLYQAVDDEPWASEDDRIRFVPGSECDILKGFWEVIPKYDRFITFNGRGFACPFLLVRSAVLGVKPTRDLMPPRYSARVHCDLLDQLSYYGATRKFSLDFYCRAFKIGIGMNSPQDKVTEDETKALFAAGEYRRIARHCLDKARATAALYRKWRKYLCF